MWTREIPFIDPVAAAARLRALPGLAFLDSAMRHDPLGRHSIVAADPFARFRYRDGRATLDGRPVAGGPMAALRACLEPYRLEPGPEPFPGGAIGYLAYDLGAALANAGRLEEARAEFEEALRLRPDFPDARANLARVMRR